MCSVGHTVGLVRQSIWRVGRSLRSTQERGSRLGEKMGTISPDVRPFCQGWRLGEKWVPQEREWDWEWCLEAKE